MSQNPFAKYKQMQENPFAKYAQPEQQEDPKEGFWGETLDYVQDRAGDFAGYAGRALSKGAQFVGSNPALGNISPAAGLMQEPFSQDAAQYVEGKSQALIDHDFGFDAQNNEYSWEKVKENKDVGTLAGFITREGLGSAPEMLAMLSGAGLAAYGVSATERMAEERAKNNNKERATLEDYSIAAPTAVATVLLDKLGFEKALGAIKQGAFKKNILASAGAEAGTEALQEGIESTATTLGTETGFDWERTADQMLAGAVAGGGMGAAINTTAQVTESLRGNPNSPENIRKKFESDIEQIKSVGREAEARGESPQVINSIKQRLDILNKEYDAFLQANDPGFVKGNVNRQEQAKAQVAEQGGDALDQANAASNVASTIADDVASENEVRLQREREAQFEIPAYQRQAQQDGLMSGALGDRLIERDQVRVNPLKTWQPNFTMPGSEQEQAKQVDGEYIANTDYPTSVPLGNNLGFDESVGAIDAMPENRVGQSDTIFTGVQREELPAPERLGLPDKFTNVIQGQDRTAELDAQEQMRQAQNAPRQTEQKDIIFGEDNRFNQGTERATVRSNGNPFPTIKSTQASRSYRQAIEDGLNPEIVKVGNGFGWETSDDIEAVEAPQAEEVAPITEQVQPTVQEEVPPTIEDNEQTETEVENLRIIEAPLSELTLSKDVPQFKSGANKDGVVEGERLEGKYDRTGSGPIQVWIRNDGSKEIITGRHRTDLARRSGEKSIPAQYHYEKNGFTKEDAASLDAILNIRDGQGKVKDYVNYFKYSKTNRQEAESEGLLARRLGQRAFTIASEGTENLISQHANDQITDEEAYRIAKAAPGSKELQNVGIKARQEGKTIAVAENMMRALSYMSDGQMNGGSLDLFGDNDSALVEAEKLAKAAAQKQSDIAKRLSAIRGAAKNPALAKQEGVDVRNEKALNQRIQSLQQEKSSWDNWHTDTAKVEQLREEVGLSTQKNDFGLTQETEQERLSREQALQSAQEVEKKAEQDLFQRQDADKEVDDFTLSGSNRTADIAAAQGQNDLFGATSTQEKDTAAGSPTTADSQNFNFSAIVRNKDGEPFFVNSRRGGRANVAPFSNGRPQIHSGNETVELSGYTFDNEFFEDGEIKRNDTLTEDNQSVSQPEPAEITNEQPPEGGFFTPEESENTEQLKRNQEDWGEEIKTARKNIAVKWNESSTDDEISTKPLSKTWPENEFDNVGDSFASAFAFAARSEIPRKPNQSYKKQRWVEKVKSYRQLVKDNVVEGLLDGKMTAEELKSKASKYNLSDFFAKVDVLNKLDRQYWGKIERVLSYPEASEPTTYVRINGRNREVKSTDPQVIAEQIKPYLEEASNTQKQMKFEVRGRKGSYSINKKGDPEYTALATFETTKEAFDFIKSQNSKLAEAWESHKQRVNVTKADMRNKENKPRTGEDYRQGKDASAEDFQEKFGIKRGTFGKWVKQGKERQDMLNGTYDALMDLSNITGVPPKALSLEGQLGFAFGANGRGKAMAHYEPGEVVINLTKTKGAGSLAHEWFHALDNYFQKKRDTNPSTEKGHYITHNPETYYIGPRGYAVSESRFKDMRVTDRSQWRKVEGVRPEVAESFKNLVDTLNGLDFAKRSSRLDKGKSNGYWSSNLEMAARAFESYVKAKMNANGYDNDFLANITSDTDFVRDDNRYPYIKADEIAEVEAAFDDLFNTIESKETESGDVALFSTPNNTNPTTTRNRASVSSADANKVIDSIISSWTGGIKARRNEFVVASTYNDLPSDIKDAAEKQGAKDNVWGVFHKGKTYVVLDKHRSTEELETTIFHETYGHHGMKKLFGKEIAQKMNQLFAANGGMSGLKAKAEQHGIDLSLYIKGTEQAGMPQEVRSRVLMEELLAHMQQDNKPSVKRMAKEVVGYIRQKLRDLGFAKLANLSDSDLFYLLKQSRDAVRKGSAKGGEVSFMMGRVSEEQLIAEGLNDPRELAYQESELERLKQSDSPFDMRKAEALENKLNQAKDIFFSDSQDAELTDTNKNSFTLKPDGIIKDTGDYLSVSIKDDSSGAISEYRLSKVPEDGYYTSEILEDGEWKYDNEFESIEEFAESIDDINEYLGEDRKNQNLSTETSLFRTTNEQTFTAPVEKKWSKDWFKRKLQDKFAPIKDMQASIEGATDQALPEDQDTYRAEELFYGKTENDLNKMEENHVKPLVDAMTQNNIEAGELDQYLMAKHAKERNKYIASINPEMQDGGSGMTNAEAAEILSRYEQEGKLAGLSIAANEVYKITEKRRQLLRESGLEDEALLDVWDAGYQFYVPLKGFANDSEGNTIAKTGKGFDIRGKESMKAMGRRTMAESPTAHAIQDLSATIIRARKNEVAQTFLNMVESNPNPEIWEVFTDENPDTERRMVNGEVKENQPVDMRYRKDDYFAVKVDGKTKYIKLKDKDGLLMGAMKNMGPAQVNIFTKAMGSATRILSALNTSYNPEFTVTNFTRDIQTALFNALAEQDLTDGKVKDKQIAGSMVKGTGKAVNALYKHARGKLDQNDPMHTWIEEFLADGAKTGYFDSKDVDQIGKDMSGLLDMTKGTNKGKLLKAKNKVFDFVENINGSIENGVRLSAYIEARRAGVTRNKAASFAKNLTVNFNRKGEAGTFLNSVYMFFNAAVQGNVNFARAILTPKVDEVTGKKSLNKAQKIAAGIVGASFGWAALMREIGGEDEDGVPYWDKIPKGVRERSFVILKPGTDGEYFKIPLPYGYNIFYNIGDAMEAAVQSDTRTKGDLAAELALSAYASFVPLGSPVGDNEAESAALVATPTLFKPIVEIATNKNFFGGEIYRENMPYGPELRDSQMSMRSTGEIYKGISRWMNDVMGDGMKYKVDGEAPLYDISPDTIEHIVEFGLGGLYRFGSRMLDTAGTVASGGDLDVTSTPFIRQVNGEIRPYEDISNFYDARQELKNIEAELKSRKGKARMEFMQEYRDKYRLRGLMSSIDKRMKLLRKQRDRIEIDDSLSFVEREERLQRIEDKMKSAVATFNEKWNETE